MQKTNTLKLNKEFKRLYYRGKSSVHPLVVTYAIRNRLGQNRIGITVTKKIGKAVCRNRCKRIIREAYRQIEQGLPQGWDFVFVARGRTKDAKSTALSPILKKQIENLTSQTMQKKQPGKSAAPKNTANKTANQKQQKPPRGEKPAADPPEEAD